MDKPKESKVRTRVMEILRNHDQEARVIEAQIAAEKEALEADLEFILTGHTTKRPNSFKSKGQPSIDKEKSP